MMAKYRKSVLAFCIVSYLAEMCYSQSSTRVTIVHTSDVHLHFAESGASSACDERTHCHGGLSRFVKFVEDLKEARSNLLVVDAGGLIPGKLLEVEGGRQAVTELVKPLPYDVMAFGAIELADGIDALAEYVKIVGQKFVCTNLEFSLSSESGRYLSNMCHKTMLKMYGELQIGIISYIDKATMTKNVTGVTIIDEVEALNAGISELEAMSADISIILALGYTHKALDLRVLNEVPKINLLIAGHSFLMFYNGTPPNGAFSDYHYPHMIHHPGGNSSWPVAEQMVAGSYFHLLYAGKLKLMTTNLKMALDPQSVSNPVYMDGEKDAETEQLVEKHRRAIDLILGQPIAFSTFLLDGSIHCHYRECAMGNLMADAMVEAALLSGEPPPPGAWALSALALLESEHVSASLERGHVYRVDLRDAVRNDTSLELLRLTGAELRWLLENCTNYRSNFTGFLHVSGLRVFGVQTHGNARPPLNISVLCTQCEVPRYEDLNDTAEYLAVVTSSLAALLLAPGGGLTLSLANRSRPLHGSLRHATADYVAKISPLLVQVGDRLMLYVLDAGTPTHGAPPAVWRLAAAVTVALLLSRATVYVR